MSDVGMTGDYQSVIGMDKDEPLGRFLRRISHEQVRGGERPGDVVGAGGRDRRRDRACHGVGPVRLGGMLEETRPVFWLAKG